MTTYTYSISGDFPNAKVDLNRLTQEITASAIVTALDHLGTDGDDCHIVFKADLSAGDETVLDGLVAAHSGEPLPGSPELVQLYCPTTSDGSPIMANVKPDRPKLTFISPNYCDKTSWHDGSTRVVDEVATDSGDHLTYNLAHANVIDLYHGKVTFEDSRLDAGGNSYRVAVKVNDVAKSEQDPHYASGGDFTVDYALGKIVFLAALQPADVVKVTYHYSGNAVGLPASVYLIAPIPGKLLVVDRVEVQFSDDCQLNDTFLFQAFGNVEVFAPQLCPVPYPPGTKIPIADPLKYKTFLDLLTDSNNSYPSYPAFGGGNWRALKKTSYLFTWNYEVGVTLLNGNYGMQIRVWMEHDAPCGGTFGIASVYCTSEDIPA